MLKKILVKKYKYKNGWDGTIKKVEIIRETDRSVFFLGGGRSPKNSNSTVFRDTPNEVFLWLKERLENEMDRAQKEYIRRKGKYDTLINMGTGWEQGA